MGSCWSSITKAGNEMMDSCSNMPPASIPQTPQTEGEILKSFSFNGLKTATRNFHPDRVLGEGSFGCVFKGWIDEQTYTVAKPETGLAIAVKKLNHERLLGHQEWLAKINFLGQLHHPNLVKFIGYCLEDEHWLLVYEFMPHGSLENHLWSSYDHSLSWKLRIKVALGVAKGLAFLHSNNVVYKDFKTSNILLDSNYDAKLSNFGLAKDGPRRPIPRVNNAYFYAAPDYMITGRATTRSNVYSFGVVLLEMLCGKPVLDDNRPSGERYLINWAKPYLTSKRRISHVLDARIQGQYSLAGAIKAAQIALKCLSAEPDSRPSMNEVVNALEQLKVS